MEMDKSLLMDRARAEVQPVNQERLARFLDTLRRYKAGKASVERRVIEAEQWWKLRNAPEEGRRTEHLGGWESQSSWLHNVLTNKHADAMDSFPQPVILAREEGDKGEAQILSSILPCILEQNHFDETYSDVEWQKEKTGTGCYKITWDATKLNGLGDISIDRVNLLNLFWEPGITDIQKSQYFFHTELVDKDVLEAQYPQLRQQDKSTAFTPSQFLYDDHVDTSDKALVVDVYYHAAPYRPDGMPAAPKLQYCKFTGSTILYASENDPQLAETGYYDHGKYPFVFDVLFPVEGSPAGYGYIDICRNPQTEIDKIKTAIVRNTMAGAMPRFFVRDDSSVNEQDYLDIGKPMIHVGATLDDMTIRPIDTVPLNGNYINVLKSTVQELRETSGNTDTSTGSTPSGVTAASAIAALQEASGKLSRDATRTSYRAYTRIIELCIELIRQFYDLPRQFRIVGQYGMQEYISYSNAGIQPQQQTAFGEDLGMRVPAFDIRVEAQKKNAYTSLAQNEMAMQFFQLGFFNPQLVDQTMACLQMMDFSGREEMMQRVSKNGQMFEMMQMLEEYAVNLAAKHGDQTALAQLNSIIGRTGGQAPIPASSEEAPKLRQGAEEESRVTQKAREQSANASQPDAKMR